MPNRITITQKLTMASLPKQWLVNKHNYINQAYYLPVIIMVIPHNVPSLLNGSR